MSACVTELGHKQNLEYYLFLWIVLSQCCICYLMQSKWKFFHIRCIVLHAYQLYAYHFSQTDIRTIISQVLGFSSISYCYTYKLQYVINIALANMRILIIMESFIDALWLLLFLWNRRLMSSSVSANGQFYSNIIKLAWISQHRNYNAYLSINLSYGNMETIVF